MSRLLAVPLVALLALALPSGADIASEVRGVVLDVFQPVTGADLTAVPCSGGAIDPLAEGFRFREVQEGNGSAITTALDTLGQPPGYLSTGCGIVVLDVEAPGAYDHVHVRFLADRRVQELAPGGVELSPQEIDFTQEVELRNATGAVPPTTYALFNDTAGNVPVQPFDVRSSTSPGLSFQIEWRFSDNSLLLSGNQAVFASGEDYASDISALHVEFSGIPLPYESTSRPERQGKLYLTETDVRFAVDEVGDADVRLDLEDSLRFAYVEAPDGSRLTETTTRNGPGPTDWNRSLVLVEGFRAGLVWVTIPKEFLAAHGPGEYKVGFTSVETAQAQPWILPFLLLILLLPLPFAVQSYRKVRSFERESFGAYRRSARNLRIALLVAILYYASVVVSSLVGNGLDVLVIWPLPLEAIVLYVQVAIAIAAFVALYAVANELDSITRPREPVLD